MTLHVSRSTRCKGSVAANGHKRFHKSPRVAISFEPCLFRLLANEAERRKIPFGAVVRERVIASYSVK